MAKKKRSPWLLGCGIGCGLVLLFGAVVVGAVAFFVRDISQPFGTAIEAREALDEKHGDVHEFTPWSDGAVPADRIEAFLQVRAASADNRSRIAEAFGVFEMSEEEIREMESKGFLEQMSFAFGISKQALGLAPELGMFFDSRNRALLEADMGLGEYTYIYVLAYHSWLGRSPGDGPDDAAVEVDTGDGVTGQADWAQGRVRRDFVRMLRNQLEALPGTAQPGLPEGWREALAGEIEALESDRRRVPWQDGLPEVIAAAFDPYRERFESSYDPITNPFELSRNRKRGLSIQAE